jgi:hypothetical protein
MPLSTLKAAWRNQESNLFFDEGCEPCTFGPVVPVADAEVLFDDVSDFRDSLVALDFEGVSLAVVESLRCFNWLR